MKEELEYDPSKDFKEFFEELQRETPRAAVILGAAFLDEQLYTVLSSFLIKNKKAVGHLLKPEGPLSTFGARIEAAYCLGLLTENGRKDLNLIRKIRNCSFANLGVPYL
jgi:DNA-binding MltR family transcriptional regulator